MSVITERRVKPVRAARRSSGAARRGRLTGALLTPPAIAALVVTILFPLLWTVWLSLGSFGLGAGSPVEFVGLQNYARILTSWSFLTALLHTLGYVAVTLIVELVVGLAIAQVL